MPDVLLSEQKLLAVQARGRAYKRFFEDVNKFPALVRFLQDSVINRLGRLESIRGGGGVNCNSSTEYLTELSTDWLV